MKIPVASSLLTQVPAFVVEEKPLFINFLEAYYEFLEQDGYSVDYIRNALSFLDVDRTLDRFVNFFWEEVKDIPLDAKVNRRLLAKHIYDLYQSKGTIKSYKLLFRILYGEDVEIYAPKVDMLRVSDGKWGVDTIIRSTAVLGDPFGLIGLTLTQSDPNATLLIQNVIKKTYGAEVFYDIYVEPLSVIGTFRYGEEATAHWTDESGNDNIIKVFLPPMPATLRIEDPGSYYEAGEVIKLYDASGQDFIARVSELGLGGVEEMLILDGGSGYSVGDKLIVDNSGTGGTGLKVSVSAVNSGVITKLNIVDPGTAYSKLPAVTGAHGGKFLPISKKIGRVLYATTADLGHDHQVQSTETTIRTVGVITDPVGIFVSGESLTLLDECLMTENFYAILAEDGTRILNEDQVSQTTQATVFRTINNQIELDGQVARRAIGIEGSKGVFLTEDGGVMINENSSVDLDRRTIVGATSGATCRIVDMNVASVLFDTGTVGVTSKQFTNADGKVSESTKRIQDSKFYQDFSYVIKSAQSIDTYKNIVQRLIHPAGLIMFGEISSENILNIGLRVIDQINNLVNFETLLNMGFRPAGTNFGYSFQIYIPNPANSFAQFDQWKFDNPASIQDSVYQADTLIANFANVKFTDIYSYDNSGNVTKYVPLTTTYTRGSELRVNGVLVTNFVGVELVGSRMTSSVPAANLDFINDANAYRTESGFYYLTEDGLFRYQVEI